MKGRRLDGSETMCEELGCGVLIGWLWRVSAWEDSRIYFHEDDNNLLHETPQLAECVLKSDCNKQIYSSQEMQQLIAKTRIR